MKPSQIPSNGMLLYGMDKNGNVYPLGSPFLPLPTGVRGMGVTTEALLGSGFLAAGLQQPLTAAKNSALALFNPANSGVNLVLTAARAWVSTAGVVRLVSINAALTTEIVAAGICSVLGNAGSVAKIYKDILAAADATVLAQTQVSTTPATSLLPLSGGLIIPPGKGIAMETETQNITLNGDFWWNEIAAA